MFILMNICLYSQESEEIIPTGSTKESRIRDEKIRERFGSKKDVPNLKYEDCESFLNSKVNIVRNGLLVDLNQYDQSFLFKCSEIDSLEFKYLKIKILEIVKYGNNFNYEYFIKELNKEKNDPNFITLFGLMIKLEKVFIKKSGLLTKDDYQVLKDAEIPKDDIKGVKKYIIDNNMQDKTFSESYNSYIKNKKSNN